MKNNTRSLVSLAVLAGLLVVSLACGGPKPSDEQNRSQSGSASMPPAGPGERVDEGSSELEVETVSDERIVPLESKPVVIPRHPCDWSRIWNDPDQPRPVPTGGAVASPEKIVDRALQLPRRDIDGGPVVVEVVIGTDGTVQEVELIQSFAPPWPEGETAILSTIREWRYQPTELDGTPIAICMTFRIQP